MQAHAMLPDIIAENSTRRAWPGNCTALICAGKTRGIQRAGFLKSPQELDRWPQVFDASFGKQQIPLNLFHQFDATCESRERCESPKNIDGQCSLIKVTLKVKHMTFDLADAFGKCWIRAMWIATVCWLPFSVCDSR